MDYWWTQHLDKQFFLKREKIKLKNISREIGWTQKDTMPKRLHMIPLIILPKQQKCRGGELNNSHYRLGREVEMRDEGIIKNNKILHPSYEWNHTVLDILCLTAAESNIWTKNKQAKLTHRQHYGGYRREGVWGSKGKRGQIHAGGRLAFRWQAHNAVYRWVIIELCAWNLYNSVN